MSSARASRPGAGQEPVPQTGGAERAWAARALIWLLGVWLVMTMAVGFLASGNFRVLDSERLRHADTVYAEIPAGEPRRLVLRYAASELNRYYFGVYSKAQLVVASAALLLLWLSRRRSRLVTIGVVIAAVSAVLVMVWLAPALTELGRQIDFTPRDPEPPDVAHFYRLHRIDVVLEMAKMVVLAAVSVILIREP